MNETGDTVLLRNVTTKVQMKYPVLLTPLVLWQKEALGRLITMIKGSEKTGRTSKAWLCLGKWSYDEILKITNDQYNIGQILLSCLMIKTR